MFQDYYLISDIMYNAWMAGVMPHCHGWPVWCVGCPAVDDHVWYLLHDQHAYVWCPTVVDDRMMCGVSYSLGWPVSCRPSVDDLSDILLPWLTCMCVMSHCHGWPVCVWCPTAMDDPTAIDGLCDVLLPWLTCMCVMSYCHDWHVCVWCPTAMIDMYVCDVPLSWMTCMCVVSYCRGWPVWCPTAMIDMYVCDVQLSWMTWMCVVSYCHGWPVVFFYCHGWPLWLLLPWMTCVMSYRGWPLRFLLPWLTCAVSCCLGCLCYVCCCLGSWSWCRPTCQPNRQWSLWGQCSLVKKLPSLCIWLCPANRVSNHFVCVNLLFHRLYFWFGKMQRESCFINIPVCLWILMY